MSGHRWFEDLNVAGRTHKGLEPGDGNEIPGSSNGFMPLVSAGAETRTLAAPTSVGQMLVLYCQTYVGDIVLTYTPTFNVTGNNTATFAQAADTLVLMSVEGEIDTFIWRAIGGDAALSTV